MFTLTRNKSKLAIGLLSVALTIPSLSNAQEYIGTFHRGDGYNFSIITLRKDKTFERITKYHLCDSFTFNGTWKMKGKFIELHPDGEKPPVVEHTVEERRDRNQNDFEIHVTTQDSIPLISASIFLNDTNQPMQSSLGTIRSVVPIRKFRLTGLGLWVSDFEYKVADTKSNLLIVKLHANYIIPCASMAPGYRLSVKRHKLYSVDPDTGKLEEGPFDRLE
jgi:hypothetical protein